MNISVRHTQYGDAAAIAAIYSQPLVYAATLQLPYPATAVWEKRLSESSDAGSHSLVALVDEEIVGHIYLAASPAVRRRHVATIGMGVSEDFFGQGVGSVLLAAAIDLAENWMAVTRMELEVYADNQPAIGLYRKFGFIDEGIAKDYAFRNGHYVDAMRMARLTRNKP